MDEQETHGFTLNQWVDADQDHFDLAEEKVAELQDKMLDLHKFCLEHNLPMIAMVITSDDRSQYAFQAQSHMPINRCNATLMAAESIIVMGIQDEEVDEFIGAIIDCDIERQARLQKPTLKLVH